MRKRIISLSIAFSILLSAAVGRVGYIMLSGNYSVSSGYNSYSLSIDKIYPTLYYSNMKSINNNDRRYVAVIRPNEKCLSELETLFSFSEIKEIKQELSKGYPVIREINNYIPCTHIQIFEAVKRTPKDADVLTRTLQSKFNNKSGERKINFTVDARGRLLDGDSGMIVDDEYNTAEGVVLTLDEEIQQIAENAANDMKKGSVVVLDADTNKILASYSKPNDSINRAFSPNCVGSVFKIVVAACAVENGVDLSYNCTGKIIVGDTEFSCQNDRAHSFESLKTALAYSCNCYFVNLALNLGADKILDTAKRLGFDYKTVLCENFTFDNGNLPNAQELHSKGQLALLGFGQGLLTATPLQIACAVSSFANGGYYISPSIISGYVDENGELEANLKNKKSKAISDKTAKTICEYMRYVVTNGTGKSADYNNNSAGKTSTAQTGKFVGDKEILNTWFAGFYPFDKPKYTIVIVTEDGTSGTVDCCPIFRTIVENLENK